METKHTPAEWHVAKLASPEHSPQFGVYADSQRNGHLAVVKGENAKADAELIAARSRDEAKQLVRRDLPNARFYH